MPAKMDPSHILVVSTLFFCGARTSHSFCPDHADDGMMVWQPRANDARPLYTIAGNGFEVDFILRYGDDPCNALRAYCSNQTRELDKCFDRFYPRLLREILRFPRDMKYLSVDGTLFVGCRSSTSSRIAATTTVSYRTASTASLDPAPRSDLKQELLHILCASPWGESPENNNITGIKLFDMRRNEVKMTPIEKMNLFQTAILIQPNSTYIINQLGLALSSMGEDILAMTLFESAVERGLWSHVLQRPEFMFVPGLASKPWHNKQDFPFIAILEKGYNVIRDELLYNLAERRHIFTGEQENNNAFSGGDWKALQLKSTPGLSSGYTKYAQYFPNTVKTLVECKEDFLLVKFSTIKPGTHIEPHTGPSNVRLRTHLTLVHTGGAKIRVGSEWRTWKEGEAMVLDSSWEHEVIHEGSDTRIILILDIWHPDYHPTHRDWPQ